MAWWNRDGSTNLDPQAKKVIKTRQGRLLIVPTRLSRSTLVSADGVMALGSMLGRKAARRCTLLKIGNWKHLFFITMIFAYLLIYFSRHNDILLHWLSCPRLHTLSSVTLTLRNRQGSFHFTNKETGACWNYASSLSGRAMIQARMSDYKAHEYEGQKTSSRVLLMTASCHRWPSICPPGCHTAQTQTADPDFCFQSNRGKLQLATVGTASGKTIFPWKISIISQKGATTQMLINWEPDKQNVVYTRNKV